MDNENRNGDAAPAAAEATSSTIKLQPPALDLNVERYAAFTSWKEKWEDYVLLSNLSAKDKKMQAAMLRYTFTSDTRKIYNSLSLTTAEKEDPDLIITALGIFAKGTINETLERHQFNRRQQHDGEKFDDFLTELKVLATNCNFCVICFPGLLRDRIRSDTVRKLLLAEKDLTYNVAVEKCRSFEVADEGMNSIAGGKTDIHHVDQISRGHFRYNGPPRYDQRKDNFKNDLLECKFCSRKHKWGRKFCPAFGKTCNVCKRQNHSPGSSMCGKDSGNDSKSKENGSVSSVQASREEEYMQTFFMGCVEVNEGTEAADMRDEGEKDSVEESEDKPRAETKEGFKNVNVNQEKGESRQERRKVERWNIKTVKQILRVMQKGEKEAKVDKFEEDFYIKVRAGEGAVRFKIDTGADVSVISEKDLKQFGLSTNDLKKTRKTLKAASGTTLNCRGYFVRNLRFKDKVTKMQCYVCDNIQTNLLGKPEITKLEVIKLNLLDIDSCSTEGADEPEYSKFPKLFNALGRIAGEEIDIKLEMKGKEPYHLTSPRRVAIPLLKGLEDELRRMEEMGVIKKVSEPTEWCHPIVLVTKPESNKLRICLDLTKLNLCVKREYYQLPSVDETLAKIGKKGQIFSKLDANSGYWQMPLNEKSQKLCTFITPFGRFCPTVGPFGLSSMPEIFSRKMDEIILGLPGVVKNMDDFLIFGETVKEHDENLDRVLSVMEEYGMTLNKDKCKFRQEKVDFLGFTVSKEGIYPKEERLSAIRKFKAPTTITELRRFMGLAQQLSKFTSCLAEVSEPLRGLLSSKNAWLWTTEHEASFEATKNLLCEPPVLAIYDVAKETKVRTDASKLHGISVIVYQRNDNVWKPVDCASRYLAPAEKQYAPIELEMLAVSWGLKRMSLYLHGLTDFLVETDHNPLVPILNTKSLIDMSPRILRLRMRTLQFRFSTKYVPGKSLVDADALSRAPVSSPTREDEFAEQEVDAYVNSVIRSMPATEERLEEIKSMTEADSELQALKEVVLRGWPDSKQKCDVRVQKYWVHRGEISYLQNLLLKEHQIIIPVEMRRKILMAIHEGHLGMEKCTRRARQSVFWPGINNEIKMLIAQCEACTSKQPSKCKEPMMVPDVPTRAWQKVGSDLYHYGGSNYVVITDYYSLYPEVYKLKSQTTDDVVVALKDSFSRHGIPEVLFSDNGPAFASYKFKQFQQEWSFCHATSSPHYPQSNGLAEVSVKSVKHLLKKCGGNLAEFQKGMLILRNSPLRHGKSPAQLLFGRQLRDNLPTITSNLEHRQFCQRDMIKDRREAKLYYDRHVPKCRKVKEEDFKPNQRIVVQNEVTKEWSVYGTVLREVAPRSYLIKLDEGRELRRNRRFLRKVFSINVCGKAKGETRIEGEIEIEVKERKVETAVNERIRNDSDTDTAETFP